MATVPYSTRSLLPLQQVRHPLSFSSEHYLVKLYGPARAPLYCLELFKSKENERWYWCIKGLTTGYVVAYSKRAGYVRPHLAERSMLAGLHKLLHPAK